MIKTSKPDNSHLGAALYYVQLKTHGGNSLFELPATDSLKTTGHDSVSSLAQIAADELLLAADHRGITVKQWVVLPNALYAFVLLPAHSRDLHEGKGKPRLLTSFVAGFKAATAKRINLLRNQPGSPVWQPSYQEQIIEDERVLRRLKEKMSNVNRAVISSQTASL